MLHTQNMTASWDGGRMTRMLRYLSHNPAVTVLLQTMTKGKVFLAQPAFLRVLLTPLHAAVGSSPVLAAVDPLLSEMPAALHLAWLLSALSSVLNTQPTFPRMLLTPLHTAVGSSPVLGTVDPLGSEVPAALHLAWLLATSSVLDTKTP